MGAAWKALERQAAALLGGRRHLRRHRGEEGPDVDLPEDSPLRAFGVEAKYRKRLPSLLLLGLAQAAKASSEGLGLLVLKARGMKGAIACLRLEDLARLLSGDSENSDKTAKAADPLKALYAPAAKEAQREGQKEGGGDHKSEGARKRDAENRSAGSSRQAKDESETRNKAARGTDHSDSEKREETANGDGGGMDSAGQSGQASTGCEVAL